MENKCFEAADQDMKRFFQYHAVSGHLHNEYIRSLLGVSDRKPLVGLVLRLG